MRCPRRVRGRHSGRRLLLRVSDGSGSFGGSYPLTDTLEPGPIHVRVGLHTGTPLVTDEGYVGDDVHRAARIAAVGHSGQVLVASSTAALVGLDGLVDLGEHRFKDLAAPERVYQLGDGEFPPLKSLYRSNLPLAANPLVGRKKELADVLQALLEGSRALTITGPGGVGKTRFALAVAGEAAHTFPDGVWFVALASHRDPALVLPTIADAIGADGDVARHIGDSQCLLFLDNFEHIVDAAPELAVLAGACPRLRLLVTSREALRIAVEREYPLSPLPESPSVELFRQRAGAVAPELDVEYATAIAICDRLDRLPLAIELAAARCKALSPEQILDRLSESLDLLRGGRDADPRQQTLRATLEWSYNLLSDEEQQLFRALSVFRGGCTLEAAEEVAGASLDMLHSLVEKSLLRFSNERYWMLETIQEYAREQLRLAGDTDAYAGRHADYFLARLGEQVAAVGYPTPEGQAWCETELDNLRAMLDCLLPADSPKAAKAANLLFMFWQARGAYAEAGQRLGMLVDMGDLTDEVRAETLIRLADTRERLGDLDGSEAAATEALTLSAPATHPRVVGLLITSAREVDRGNVDEGLRLAWLAVQEAEGMAASTHVAALGDLGWTLIQAGRRDEARAVIVESVEEARRSDLAHNAAWGVGQLGFIDLLEGDYETASRELASALTHARSMSFYPFETEMLHALGYAYIGLGRRRDARMTYAELLELAVASGASIKPEVALAVCGLAFAVEPGDFGDGARLLGAIRRLRRDAGVKITSWWVDEELGRRFEQRLIDGLGEQAFSTEQATGAGLSLEETIALARSLADS